MESNKRLQVISQDKQLRMEYEAREKAVRDHNQMLLEADRRGEERGLKKGREEGRKEGREEGMEIGENRASLRFNELILLLSRDNRFADLTRSANDPAFQKQLMEEYGIE